MTIDPKSIFRDNPFPAVFFRQDGTPLHPIPATSTWKAISRTSTVLNLYVAFRTDSTIDMMQFWDGFAEELTSSISKLCQTAENRFFVYYATRLLVHVSLMQATTAKGFKAKNYDLQKELADIEGVAAKVEKVTMLPSSRTSIDTAIQARRAALKADAAMLSSINNRLQIPRFDRFRKQVFRDIASIICSEGVAKTSIADFLDAMYSRLAKIEGIPDLGSDSILQIVLRNRLPDLNTAMMEISEQLSMIEAGFPSGADAASDRIRDLFPR